MAYRRIAACIAMALACSLAACGGGGGGSGSGSGSGCEDDEGAKPTVPLPRMNCQANPALCR